MQVLVGTRTSAALHLADFCEYDKDIAFIRHLLTGALRPGASGINVLFNGPPGGGPGQRVADVG